MKSNSTKGISALASGLWVIKELEVSITAKCHLRCVDCGFLVPLQPAPNLEESSIAEISYCLQQLDRLNIWVSSMAILGGEPTFDSALLEEALVAFSKFEKIGSLEVVTHGLTPQGISKLALSLIDKLTISVYYDNQELSELWKKYVAKFSRNTTLSFRENHQWDPWQQKAMVDDEAAQVMYDTCWYRRHCTTIERGRLFVCSRIPKEGRDEEGIRLLDHTKLEDVIGYLNQDKFLPACKECTPMMGLPTKPGGRQPDQRVSLLASKAISFLKLQMSNEYV